MKATNKPKIDESVVKKLTFILLMQNIAGARNVKPIKRLEALHNDIGSLILGKEPNSSKELV